MVSLAILYLLLGAEFLAAAQVIVYSGAIMVLFTFVIMLLNAGEEDRGRSTSKVASAAGFPGVVALLCLLSYVFLSQKGWRSARPNWATSWCPPRHWRACSSATSCCRSRSPPC